MKREKRGRKIITPLGVLTHEEANQLESKTGTHFDRLRGE